MSVLSEIKLFPADLGLVNSDGIFGALIRPAESMAYGKVDSTHAFCFLGSIFTPPSVVEQLWLMTTTPITSYDGKQVKVWRNKKWTDTEKIQIATQMLSISNYPYPIWKLPLNLLDLATTGLGRLIGRKKPCFFFTKLGRITSFVECMQAYAWAAYKVFGRDDIFGCGWRSIDPEGADQWCEAHPEEWELVKNFNSPQ